MAVTGVNSAKDIRMDYMTLLVTQMKNQNPLEPMSNDQMAMQMAQFSELEQLENMNSGISKMIASNDTLNSSFAKVLAGTQADYAKTLVGKQITYTDKNGHVMMGLVDQIEITSEGPMLRVANIEVVDGEPVIKPGQNTVGLEQVVAIGSEEQVLLPNKLEYAKTLVDRNVVYIDPVTGNYKTGVVDGINVDGEKVYLRVEEKVLSLDSIRGVSE